MKKQITLRALTARIQRKLSKENKKLTKFDAKWLSTYGEYGVIDLETNTITSYNLDIVELSRDIGALAAYEELV